MLFISSYSTQSLLLLSFIATTIIGTLVTFGALIWKFDKLNKENIISFLKRRLIYIIAAYFIFTFLIFSILFLFQNIEKQANKSIKIVSATEFIKSKQEVVKNLQTQGYSSWDTVGMLIIDLRSKEEFDIEHIKGSGQYSFDKVAKNLVYVKGVDFVLVTSKSGVQKAKDLAKTIEANRIKNGKLAEPEGEKIYVISDGYEGLKALNLKLETGGWD